MPSEVQSVALHSEGRILALTTIRALENYLKIDDNRATEPAYSYAERLRHLVYDIGSVLAEANHALESIEERAGL